MKWPHHVTPQREERVGQAPYNFVPLPEAVLTVSQPCSRTRLHEERHHGWLDITIVTETPLYTRCAYPRELEGRPANVEPLRQDFFHHGDRLRPVIPGSSLRGMVRNLVEILTFSRLSRKNEQGEAQRSRSETLIFRAVAEQTSSGDVYRKVFLGRRGHMEFDYPHSNVRAGWLETNPHTGEWGIRPAQTLPLTAPPAERRTFARVLLNQLSGISCSDNSASMDLFVEPGPVRKYPSRRVTLWYSRVAQVQKTKAQDKTLVRARLVCSGHAVGRHMHTVVYPPDPNAALIPVPRAMREKYEADRDMTRGIPARPLRSSGEPMFYLLDEHGHLRFFGPTIFFRLPYDHSTQEFLPGASGGTELKDLDMAEAMFGTVYGNDAVRGRISFEDALVREDQGPLFLEGANDGRRKPAVLSTPKPTSYQNYLVQSDPGGDSLKLANWNSTPESDTVLRGFKRYWHRGHPPLNALSIELPGPEDTQSTVIRPVRPGVTFNGRIRFENLTDVELGALLAALELPAGSRHQLGMGKPHGLGSVSITIIPTLINPMRRFSSFSDNGFLDASSTGTRVQACREQFRLEIVSHFNQNVTRGKVETGASIWDVPRIADLRRLLTWDNRPNSSRTDYLTPKTAKSRQVLPTPAFVMGEEEPRVEAEGLPLLTSKPPPQKSSATPPHHVKRGRILSFTEVMVRLKLDGEPTARNERLDARRFPLESWGRLNSKTMAPNTRIDVELDAEGGVLRVLKSTL